MNLEEVKNFACNLAREAGELVKDVYSSGQCSTVEQKSSPVDLVTETDQAVEALIIKRIKSTYPDHKFIGEESVADGAKCQLTEEPTWIVDPIDGTTNFVHRIPNVAICIGFCIGKVPTLGVVYNPCTDELFVAVKGKGATCNGVKINVSNQTDLSKSIIMTEFGSSRDEERMNKIFENMKSVVTNPVHGVRSIGTAALNMMNVAKGCSEAYYEFGVHCWDYCAASVVVTEAGGVCVDTTGKELDLMSRRVIAACNISIAKSLSDKIIHQMELPRD